MPPSESSTALLLWPRVTVAAHEDRAIYLGFIGRRAEALAEITKINQLDSGPSSAMAESAAYYELRDYRV